MINRVECFDVIISELAFSQEFFSGGGNLLLCKFLLLFYCFRTTFQGGAKVFKGEQTASGGGRPPVGESQPNANIITRERITFKGIINRHGLLKVLQRKL